MQRSAISRRKFLQHGTLAAAAGATRKMWGAFSTSAVFLAEFGYGDVMIASDLHESQLTDTIAVLMALNEDSLLKPLRQLSGLPAPGEDLGGWYTYDPGYDYQKDFDVGFSPGCSFPQWVSGLARAYAITGDRALRDKVLRLNRLYAETISTAFYRNNRFPAYTYDKLVLALIESHTLVNDPDAMDILERTSRTALPCLPGVAIEHDLGWRADKDPKDLSWNWDESYTLPENLFLAYQRGAGRQYFDLGLQFLDDKTWFDPLSRNEHVLHGRHAYSYVNSLCSAMAAYMVAGSEKHLHAATNAFAMLQAQSFATGGWGPDEMLRGPDSNDLYESLSNTHHSFETPCGSYAHFKLTRYLLRVTHDSRYGDSMERVMYNTILGAKPLQENGKNFYYADCNFDGQRVYKQARWACCSGTLPQVAADYRINIYFRGPGAVYVNLYVPSTLRWVEHGVALSLTQEGEYPYEDRVAFTLTASRPVQFALRFRIPAWAEGASISVNGVRQKGSVIPGQFATLLREWKTGDMLELELPFKMRLEPIDARHPDTVALLRGPLVLLALKELPGGPVPSFERANLLGARRIGERQWEAVSREGRVALTPFTAVGDRLYTTYVKTL